MITNGHLTVGLQENLLILLCFSVKASPLIRNAVSPPLFGSRIYRDIVVRVYDYIDKYHKPPADHLPDLFDDELEKGDARAKEFAGLIEEIFSHREQVNEEFALSQLEAFVRQQTLKGSIITASEAIQEGDLDRAETVLQSGLKQRLELFNPGTSLADGIRLAYSHQTRRDCVSTGVRHLDDWSLGPARGELHLFIAAPKRGKTWWLINIAKQCLLHRLRVVYVTLEINEAQIAQRMVQSLFSMLRRKAKVPVTRLRIDELGRLLRFEQETITGRMSFDDATSRPIVEGKLRRLHGRENLVIKAFPTGMLTVHALSSYLDMLERAAGFVPDMLVVDYPDLMKVDSKNYRIDLGAVYRDLRGLAVARNIGVVCASQANREGAVAKLITEAHTAEDFSKIATADTVISYSQTAAERELGLARLFVSNSRVGDRDRFVVMINQAYPIGQFCFESVQMSDNYWGHVEQATQNNGNREEDDSAEE